jgi:hypothetical protein
VQAQAEPSIRLATHAAHDGDTNTPRLMVHPRPPAASANPAWASVDGAGGGGSGKLRRRVSFSAEDTILDTAGDKDSAEGASGEFSQPASFAQQGAPRLVSKARLALMANSLRCVAG